MAAGELQKQAKIAVRIKGDRGKPELMEQFGTRGFNLTLASLEITLKSHVDAKGSARSNWIEEQGPGMHLLGRTKANELMVMEIAIQPCGAGLHGPKAQEKNRLLAHDIKDGEQVLPHDIRQMTALLKLLGNGTAMAERPHQAFIALSNWERSLDFHPLRAICQGNRILDLGCHFGMNSFEALQVGASHVTSIDSDPQCVQAARQILGQKRATVLERDLSMPNVLSELGFTKESFETVFYLALHQHLELRKKGSGDSLLAEVLSLSPLYLAIRSREYTHYLRDMLKRVYGSLCFYGGFTQLGPLMVFRRHDQT